MSLDIPRVVRGIPTEWSRKMHTDKYRNPTKAPWGKLRPAPTAKRHPKLKTGAIRDTYDLAHAAWRAGAIGDFYYGERAPGDPTVVWEVDGIEYSSGATAEVRAVVLGALGARRIAGVAFGASWMGYRELVVTFSDGSRLVQGWDGRKVVVSEVAA